MTITEKKLNSKYNNIVSDFINESFEFDEELDLQHFERTTTLINLIKSQNIQQFNSTNEQILRIVSVYNKYNENPVFCFCVDTFLISESNYFDRAVELLEIEEAFYMDFSEIQINQIYMFFCEFEEKYTYIRFFKFFFMNVFKEILSKIKFKLRKQSN